MVRDDEGAWHGSESSVRRKQGHVARDLYIEDEQFDILMELFTWTWDV